MWTRKYSKIDNVEIIIWYGAKTELYPISDYLHPGIIPIGNTFTDDHRHNLPNLDWLIHYLIWLGFTKISVVSSYPFKGLQRYYKQYKKEFEINFHHSNLYDFLVEINHEKSVLLLNGLIFSTGNYREAVQDHIISRNKATLLSLKGLQYRVGIVKIDGNDKVEEFVEKPFDLHKLVNTNTLVLDYDMVKENVELRNYLKKLANEQKNGIKHIINWLLQKNYLYNHQLLSIRDKLVIYDLQSIENWRKLDIDKFIEDFGFLHE